MVGNSSPFGTSCGGWCSGSECRIRSTCLQRLRISNLVVCAPVISVLFSLKLLLRPKLNLLRLLPLLPLSLRNNSPLPPLLRLPPLRPEVQLTTCSLPLELRWTSRVELLLVQVLGWQLVLVQVLEPVQVLVCQLVWRGLRMIRCCSDFDRYAACCLDF